MKTLGKFFYLFGLVFLLVGCSSNQHSVMRVNLGAEPTTLDPRKARDLQAMTLSRMFFEGLTRINQEDKAELALAEKVDVSADGKMYTFTLRSAVWTNGDKVTAPDFVYAWTKSLDPHFPSDQAFQLYVIKNAKAAKEGKVGLDQVGVKALNEKTLQVELQNPTPYFLEVAALPIYFPFPAKADQNTDLKTVIGNGPFILKEWRHNDLIRAAKNPSYWDASSVKLKEICLTMVQEETELKMFEKGELDWAGSPLSTLPINALSGLKKTGNLHVRPFLATYFFRTNVESELFEHPLIRKAFAEAIKRSEIVEHVTQGGQMPAMGLLPPSLRGFGGLEKGELADGDIQQARRDFDQALELLGIGRQELPSISLMYVSGERNHLIAQAVQEQWRKALDVNVELEAVERKVYFDRLSKKNYQLASGNWTADYNDGMNFLEIFKFKAGGSNNTAWENARYRELLDRAAETVEAGQRQHLFQECENILMKEMPIIPVFYYTMLYVSNPKIKGVVLSNLGSVDFKWASVDQ
ncbi:MAG TPA: peptide ABC transporter substrate-binding protein [Rhabdochlamydiaceae bacterium]|jgi:oligopeptide transport system substrate-binding protein|nr:peptide ABC transporter substrate-binding protein [Rhabdochlamydiaceae bacterium]